MLVIVISSAICTDTDVVALVAGSQSPISLMAGHAVRDGIPVLQCCLANGPSLY